MVDDDAVPAQVVEVIGRTGISGEATQCMLKVLDGRDKGKVLRRNVIGPIKAGDLLMIRGTHREDKDISAR